MTLMPSGDAAINRGLTLSFLLGPARTLIPTMLSLILCSILLRTGGLKLVGLWGTIQLFLLYFSLFGLGFGRHIQQQIAIESSIAEIERDFRAILGGYGILFSSILAVLLLIAYTSNILPDSLRSNSILLALVIASSFLTQIGTLQGAVLAGNHKLYLTQSADSLQSFILFIVAATGSYLGFPVPALVIGVFIGALGRIFVISLIIRHYYPNFLWINPIFPEKKRSLALLKATTPYFLLELTEILRYPLVRIMILLSTGTSGLGIYDLANKIPQVMRDALSSGLIAIFPATAIWNKTQKTDRSIYSVAKGVIFTSMTSIPLLCLYYFASPYIIKLWLGENFEKIENTTKILTIWWLLSSYSIPLWWAAIGQGYATLCAGVSWLQISSLLLLWVLGSKLEFGIEGYALGLLCSGILMQGAFLFLIQAKTNLVSATFLNQRARISVTLSFLLFLGTLLAAWIA